MLRSQSPRKDAFEHSYLNTSTPQHLNTSTPQHLNTSTPQHLNTSTPQHLNTSTPQHIPHDFDRLSLTNIRHFAFRHERLNTCAQNNRLVTTSECHGEEYLNIFPEGAPPDNTSIDPPYIPISTINLIYNYSSPIIVTFYDKHHILQT
jgi:hypothetical protein